MGRYQLTETTKDQLLAMPQESKITFCFTQCLLIISQQLRLR